MFEVDTQEERSHNHNSHSLEIVEILVKMTTLVSIISFDDRQWKVMNVHLAGLRSVHS